MITHGSLLSRKASWHTYPVGLDTKGSGSICSTPCRLPHSFENCILPYHIFLLVLIVGKHFVNCVGRFRFHLLYNCSPLNMLHSSIRLLFITKLCIFPFFSEIELLKELLPEMVRFEPSWEELELYKDGGLAVIDQWICAHAR